MVSLSISRWPDLSATGWTRRPSKPSKGGDSSPERRTGDRYPWVNFRLLYPRPGVAAAPAQSLPVGDGPIEQTKIVAAQPESTFPQDQMAKGIALGKQFTTRKQFIETGLKQNKIQISSAWAKDGISKYVTFYRDYHVVAARVAEATQQLRDVSEKDLSAIPYRLGQA
jgi:hypothetical protein